MSNIFKILVVEAESITAMELQKKLVSWGYDVLGIVSSGENAVEKAFELEPDLILMDIILKGDMTGIDAAEVIKNKLEIPIIYLTAYFNETFEGAKITQPAAYLIKPFQESELRFAIDMAFYCHQSKLKLMESETKYHVLAESTQDMIFIINNDFFVDYINESSLKYLKLSKEQIIGKPLHQIFPEQVFEVQKQLLQEIFRSGKSKCSEDIIVAPDHESCFETCLKPLEGNDGEIYAVMGITRDVSPYKKPQIEFQDNNNLNQYLIENRTLKSLDERNLLIRDIHNSVKNNLKWISTILNCQSDYIKDNQIRQMFQVSENRVKVLELIHEKFSQSEDLANLDFADYLKSLVDFSFKVYQSQRDNVDYKLNSEKILLDIDTAMPLGLIVHELVSNSLKHAFSEDRGGEINLQFYNTDSNLIMDVRDNGLGLPPTFNFEKSENLGFKIVKTLVDEINAEIEVKNDAGVHVMIKVPKNSLDC